VGMGRAMYLGQAGEVVGRYVMFSFNKIIESPRCLELANVFNR